jgi:hypothetical protein
VEKWLAPLGEKLLKNVPESQRARVNPINYYVLAGLLFSSLLAYAGTSYLLYRELFASRWWYQALIPILVLLVLIPFVSRGVGHVYDFTVLMFMSALLYAMKRHRHWLYTALFAASCLNKESTLLIAFAYGSYFCDRQPPRNMVLFLGIQAAIFMVIYGAVRYTFAANPGMGMEHWWAGQIAWFSALSFEDLTTFLLILALIVYRWHKKPVLLRRSAAMLIPHGGLFVIGAYPGEMRNFYESLPLLTLFVCRNVELLGRRCLGRSRGRLESSATYGASFCELWKRDNT